MRPSANSFATRSSKTRIIAIRSYIQSALSRVSSNALSSRIHAAQGRRTLAAESNVPRRGQDVVLRQVGIALTAVGLSSGFAQRTGQIGEVDASAAVVM